MFAIRIIVFLALAVTFVAGFPTEDTVKHYHGYKVITAVPRLPGHFEALLALASQDKYDFWTEPRPNARTDILVSPSDENAIMNHLAAAGIPHVCMIPDVEKLLQEERLRKSKRRPLKYQEMDWEEYHTWSEVNNWLSSLVSSSSLMSQEVYGQSFEGRPLSVYKISTGPAANGTIKPAFWIDATIHAREHITTGVITYIINQLVTNSTAYADILNGVDFYVAPFINPDGYVYTHEVDRLFRRTRSNWTNSTCIGVDANRNFGFQFGGAGSSSNPCSETYRGPQAYSEPETDAVKDYISLKQQAQNVSFEAFITLHSYSQLWMSPYGYTEEAPADYPELKQLADQAVAELASHFGTRYIVGNAGAVLYLSSGSSRDWAKGAAGIKWVYTIELRDTGRYGFLLPADQILDTSIETWAGIQVVARKLLR